MYKWVSDGMVQVWNGIAILKSGKFEKGFFFPWGHSCDLSHSCGNARYLTLCARPETELASQGTQDPANPFTPHQELLEEILWRKWVKKDG